MADRSKLDKLLELARNYTMTDEEIAAQRRSWVRGQLLLSNPGMSAEDVDRLLDGHK